MNIRYILTILLIFQLGSSVFGMDYGLRFKSHSVPANHRTSLSLGEETFKFTDELSVEFKIHFYDKDCFGLICTLQGDDGTIISLVSSAIDGDYKAGVLINDDLRMGQVSFLTTDDNYASSVLTLDKRKNQVSYTYGNDSFNIPADLSKIKNLSVKFGRTYEQSTIAPIDIKDINVFVDKQNINRWELRDHYNDTTIDIIHGAVAVAKSPHWLFDEHSRWTEIFSNEGPGGVQSAYNPADGLFYIVSSSDIIVYNPLTGKSSVIDIPDDGRIISGSNHLTFDTITGELISYGLSSMTTNRFNFNDNKWSHTPDLENRQPHFANHAYAEDKENNAYMFGGYGFYLYQNELMKLNLKTGGMQPVNLNPKPESRMYASMCIIGNKLYIFGGFGNAAGKQEVPATNYYDLWEYDLSTMQGRKVCEMDSVRHHFLPSAQMYYSDKDSCFFFASTLYGGCMMRLTTDPMTIDVVSQPIKSNMDYRDCAFSLYRAKDRKTYYFVINKTLNDNDHDLKIYKITYPFALFATPDSNSDIADAENNRTVLPIIAIIVIIMVCFAVFLLKRKQHSVGKHPVTSSDNEKSETSTSCPDSDRESISPVNETEIQNERHIPGTTNHFNRDISAISLLGRFEVRDKNGADITTRLSHKMQRTLIMLILYSEKDEKGVNGLIIDRDVWPDKDEKSAKKNRNVCIYKLRSFLEDVGDVEISYERGYYRIIGHSVCIDYHEVMHLFKEFEGNDRLSGDNLERVIELLFFGPLLPSITLDYLDEFKSSYTDESLMILNKLLNSVKDIPDRQNQAYKIAETIIKHDPLNEIAIAAKCRILYDRNMRGPARDAYDRFCREYEKSYGEEYNVPFSTILHSSEAGQ